MTRSQRADKKAKGANYTNIDLMTNLSKTEMRDIVKQRIKEKWQQLWDEVRKGRWYYRIQSKVGGMSTARKLKLGHAGLNKTL